MKYNPHAYQLTAKDYVFEHPFCALFMDMGLGKTAIMLDAIHELMYGDMSVRKVLVIAPKKVAETTWTDERDKWDEFKPLKIKLVLGTIDQRLAALKRKADIYVINRENVQWIVGLYQTAWPFDMVVVDESSSFKNHQAQRFKSLRMVRPKMLRCVLLTGTPSPNGLADLWPQMYLIDQGERLGKMISHYRNTYLSTSKIDGAKSKDSIVYKYGVTNDNSKRIYDKIKDVVISMRAKDYLSLPQRIETTHKIKLPDKIYKQYKEFEKTEVLTLLDANEGQISAANAATLIGKLLQFANGAVYKPESYIENQKQPREWVTIHDEKLEALGEIIEAAQDEPVLIFYQFQHDLARIQAKYGAHKYSGPDDLKRWNEGKIPILAAHPASVAYGLNMQAGGRIIVWYGVPFSLELWAQGNARLDRQGQLKPVQIHKLAMVGTADLKTIGAIESKDTGQNALMDAVKAIVKEVKESLKNQ